MKGKFFVKQASASFVGSLLALAIFGGLAYIIYKNEYPKPAKPKTPKEPKPTETVSSREAAGVPDENRESVTENEPEKKAAKKPAAKKAKAKTVSSSESREQVTEKKENGTVHLESE